MIDRESRRDRQRPRGTPIAVSIGGLAPGQRPTIALTYYADEVDEAQFAALAIDGVMHKES